MSSCVLYSIYMYSRSNKKQNKQIPLLTPCQVVFCIVFICIQDQTKSQLKISYFNNIATIDLNSKRASTQSSDEQRRFQPQIREAV